MLVQSWYIDLVVHFLAVAFRDFLDQNMVFFLCQRKIEGGSYSFACSQWRQNPQQEFLLLTPFTERFMLHSAFLSV